MKRQTYIIQTYEEYLDYSDYPEGARRSRLVGARKASPEECASLGVTPDVVGNWHYYRITQKAASA